MNYEQELIYAIAISKLKNLSLINARILFDEAGSATNVFAAKNDIRSIIPDANERLIHVFDDTDYALRLAETEMAFINAKNVQAMTIADAKYPQRMKKCADAPIVLYGYGDVDYNRKHVVNIIGTRKCTEYGREMCRRFVADLKEIVPDTLIVSGLAYGIDITAHRAAVENRMDTVAVLAHGLDNIYPAPHRQTAVDMVRNGGGLLTEYTTHTTPERMNFVRRNRIVAGISDACIVVESASKGGSLITARLAVDYGRELYAYPGRVSDESSAGCNTLIKRREATLITSAEDFAIAAKWTTADKVASKNKKAVQGELFPTLTDEESKIVDVLRNVDDMHINQISQDTGISFSRTSMVLFELEMKGLVRALGGARYCFFN